MSEAPRPLNVLILCSDEHARRVAGCYGDPVAHTPALDELARLGVRFDNAYSPSPICVPARASLATGLQVHETRCWSSAEPYFGQHESWMHRLRAAGHPVVSVGKLHFRKAGDDHGFDEEIEPMYLADEGRGWVKGLLREPLPSYDDTGELARDIGPGETSYTEYDRRVAAEAVKWLKKYAGKFRTRPWCLFVSFASPHYPLKCPPDFYRRYAHADIPEPPGTRPEHPVLEEMRRFWNYDDHFDDGMRKIARASYYGLVSFLDENLRQVLAALEDTGTARDTLVVYISDHGEMLGSHGFWTKSVMYEDSVGVPLIMSGPGIDEGACETLVSLTDVAATVERAVGLEPRLPDEPWMSTPLQHLCALESCDRFIVSQYHDGGSPCGITMLRHGQWKYVHYAGRDCPQLFDLAKDPCELEDLSRSRMQARMLEQMRTLLGHVLDPEAINAQALGDQRRLIEKLGGAEALARLDSFGYTPV